jgi:hypothetical protein
MREKYGFGNGCCEQEETTMKKELRELKTIALHLRAMAEDLRDERNDAERADPEFDARRLEKYADDLDVIRTNIRGSGTGED